MNSAKTMHANRKFVAAKPEKFWNEAGVFPRAITGDSTVAELESQARRILVQLGLANLRLLCEQQKLPLSRDADDRRAAQILLDHSETETILYLKEFMRGRIEWIDRTFNEKFGQRKRRSLLNDLASHGNSRSALKPLTKLLLIFCKSPTTIHDIFYFNLWSARSTVFEFQHPDGFPKSFPRILQRMYDSFEQGFANTTNRSVKFIGWRQVSKRFNVFVFLREYGVRVRRDFRNGFTVHNDCGLIVLGFDRQEQRIHVKSANARIADVVQRAVEDKLGCELELLKNEVYCNYNAEFTRNAILGAYNSTHGIDVVEIAFERSALPGSPSLSIKSSLMQPSVKAALEHMTEADLLSIRGASDLQYFVVTFEGKSAQITSEITDGGACRLRFDNAGWQPGDQERFEATFAKTFGIPLNRRLDPRALDLGSIGIVSYLMNITSSADVERYQRDSYDALVDSGVLQLDREEVSGCRSGICKSFRRIVSDGEQTHCHDCSKELQSWTITTVSRSQEHMANVIRPILAEAGDWSLGEKAQQFDNRKYHALIHPEGGEEGQICLLFHDRLTPQLKTTFYRRNRPLLVVQAHTDRRRVYVDEDGIGRVSFSYLFSAQTSEEDRRQAVEDCRTILRRLVLTHEENVQKAARASYSILCGDRSALTGPRYETEIFNILRALLPYTLKLGREGKVEPDGLSCVPFYAEAASIDDVESWNWTYDAKFSNKVKGYDLDIDEARKMVNYINKFRDNRKVLAGKNRKIRAHVIISNNISDAKKKKAAKFVFGDDGVKKTNRDVKLVFLDERYLISLYEWMQSHSQQFRTKRPHFGDLLIKQFSQAPAASYIDLQKSDAEDMLEDLEGYRVVESTVPSDSLLKSLDNKK